MRKILCVFFLLLFAVCGCSNMQFHARGSTETSVGVKSGVSF